MELEENVYGQASQTEKGIDAEKGDKAQKDSTVLGKFKDVGALARAYNALQAEFTRRSQRLKELEKQAENPKGADKAVSGAEKLRKTAEARRTAAKAFDEFVATVGKVQPDSADGPDAKDLPSEELSVEEEPKIGLKQETEMQEEHSVKTEMEEKVSQDAEAVGFGGKGAEVGGDSAVQPVANSGNTVLSSDELYAKVCGDEGVRLRIIGEYLTSIGRSSAPITVGNAGTLASPPVRMKNISEASQMALQFLKK